MRLIMEEHRIGKLYEASVQRFFFKDHLNSANCSLASFEASTWKSNI